MRRVNAAALLLVPIMTLWCGPAAADKGQGDSNVFEIVSAGTGVLAGTVHDADTGLPVDGAAVVTPSHSTQTLPDGTFEFPAVDAGNVLVEVSKAGYHGAEKTVTVWEGSRVGVPFEVHPAGGSAPRIVSARATYCEPGRHAYYLAEVHGVHDDFTVTVDWGGFTPGEVRWTLSPSKTGSVPCPTNEVTLGFDMGFDFIAGENLQLEAVTGDNPPQASPPYFANFDVIPAPTGIDAVLLRPSPRGGNLIYSTSWLLRSGSVSMVEGSPAIPGDFPLFGGAPFEFGAEFNSALTLDANHVAARAEAPFYTVSGDPQNRTKMAGVSFDLAVGGTGVWEWDSGAQDWRISGHAEFDALSAASVPPAPGVFFVGPVPCYLRGKMEVEAAGILHCAPWSATGEPEWSGQLNLDPMPYAEGMLGVGAADVMAVEGYLGGGGRMILDFPPVQPGASSLTKAQLYLAGGFRIYVLFAQYEWPDPPDPFTWDISRDAGGRVSGNPGLGRARVMPRDYLYNPQGYAVFVANAPRAQFGIGRGTIEESIQLNVLGQSTPALATLGDDVLLTWIYDDPLRTPVNRFELVFSHCDGATGAWTGLAAIEDDGTADFHPCAAPLSGGDALVAWENVKEVLTEPGPGEVEQKLAEMKSKTEIAVCRFDGVGAAFSTAATVLTDDLIFDRSPALATAADGTALLAWVSNAASSTLGSSTEPNTLKYSYYDGAAWSAPADVAVGLGAVMKMDLAYDGTDGVLLFTLDTDDDPQTPGDRELRAIEYFAGAWGAVLPLTADTAHDAGPQVAYDAGGALLLVWYRDGDIAMETHVNPASFDPQVVLDLGGPRIGATDLRLATRPTGEVAMVWQEVSEDMSDLWYATYDPGTALWSSGQRLTTDAPMEYAVAPAFTAGGQLVMAYDKMPWEYGTQYVDVSGEVIEVDNVPVPAYDDIDLYFLRHDRIGDLAVFADEVGLSNRNPLPGEQVEISAVIRNLGDIAAANIEVQFLDGATVIGSFDVTGPLVGGGEAEALVNWDVPASAASHDITVLVDPYQVQQDDDLSNNTAVLAGVMKPDLVIDSMLVHELGPRHHILTIRVANHGSLDVNGVSMALHENTVDGRLITTIAITDTIAPGAFVDASYQWQPAGYLPTEMSVCAVVDEAQVVEEFDEDNNARSAVVWSFSQKR